MGQKKRNDQNSCLAFLRYLNLHFSIFKELQNEKKKKVGQTDRQTDSVTKKKREQN